MGKLEKNKNNGSNVKMINFEIRYCPKCLCENYIYDISIHRIICSKCGWISGFCHDDKELFTKEEVINVKRTKLIDKMLNETI